MTDAYSFQTSGCFQIKGTFQRRLNFQSVCPLGIQVFWTTDNYVISLATHMSIYFGKGRMCAAANVTATHTNVRHLAKKKVHTCVLPTYTEGAKKMYTQFKKGKNCIKIVILNIYR
jgi:hypothetical protein